MIADYHDDRICVVNCGLPGDQCACYRSAMRQIYSGLLANQLPPDPEIDRVWDDNVEGLYEA